MDTIQNNVNEAIASLNAIKDKIVEKGVDVAEGTKTRLYANKVDDVYEAGKKAEYDAFWDEAFKNGGSWIYRFAGYCWTDKTFKPSQDLIATGNSNNIFNNSLITDLTAILNKFS